jgi:hypothetical protein
MAGTDWTAFELLAEGWEQHVATTKKAGITARGVELCAKQLRETIARAKADADED